VLSGGQQTMQYSYDAFGQRLVKVGTTTATTLFQYDRAGHLLEQTDGTGSAQVDYIYLGDRPLATFQPSNGKLYFLHDDRLGTPQVATDSTQAAVWIANYEPFGNTSTGAALIAQDLRLPGQEFEIETGWNHNGFRDYAPTLGRYLQSDPIGLGGGINLYGYAGQNPVRRTDSAGLCIGPLIVYCTVEAVELGVAGVEFAAAVYTGTPSPTSVLGEVGGAASQAEAQCVSRTGTDLMAHPFSAGGTHITTTDTLAFYAESATFGGSNGLFLAPTAQVDALLASGASPSQIEFALGLEEGSLGNGTLVRIDVADPFARNLSLPSSGNMFFRPGGLTTGNLYEGVVTSPLKTDPGITLRSIP